MGVTEGQKSFNSSSRSSNMIFIYSLFKKIIIITIIVYRLRSEVRPNTDDWSSLGMHGNQSGPIICESSVTQDQLFFSVWVGGWGVMHNVRFLMFKPGLHRIKC